MPGASRTLIDPAIVEMKTLCSVRKKKKATLRMMSAQFNLLVEFGMATMLWRKIDEVEEELAWYVGGNMEIRGTLVRSGYGSPIGRLFEFDEKCLCTTAVRS